MMAHNFEGGDCLHQLRFFGLTDVLVLMQQGFPSRTQFTELYGVYKPMMNKELQRLEPRIFFKVSFIYLFAISEFIKKCLSLLTPISLAFKNFSHKSLNFSLIFFSIITILSKLPNISNVFYSYDFWSSQVGVDIWETLFRKTFTSHRFIFHSTLVDQILHCLQFGDEWK